MNPDQQQKNRDQPEGQQAPGQESGVQQNPQTVPPPQLASPVQQQNEPSTGAAGQALVTDPKTGAVSKGVHVPLEVQEGGTSTSSGPAPVTTQSTGAVSKLQSVPQSETPAETKATEPSTEAPGNRPKLVSPSKEIKKPDLSAFRKLPAIRPIGRTSSLKSIESRGERNVPRHEQIHEDPSSSTSSLGSRDLPRHVEEEQASSASSSETRRRTKPSPLRRIQKGTSRLLFGPSQSSGAEAQPPSALQQFVRRALGKRRDRPAAQSIEATPDEVAIEEQQRQQQQQRDEAQQFYDNREEQEDLSERMFRFLHDRVIPMIGGRVLRDEIPPQYSDQMRREYEERTQDQGEYLRRRWEMFNQRSQQRFDQPPSYYDVFPDQEPRDDQSVGESQEGDEEAPDFHQLFPETALQDQLGSTAQAQVHQTPDNDEDLVRRLGLNFDELQFIDEEEDDEDAGRRN